MRDNANKAVPTTIRRNTAEWRPTTESGTYRGPAKLGRNDPCPCAKLNVPGADTLPAHKAKRHNALYEPIRQRVIAERTEKLMAEVKAQMDAKAAAEAAAPTPEATPSLQTSSAEALSTGAGDAPTNDPAPVVLP